MTHSKGISWFDDCRIPFVDEVVRINTYNDGTFDPKNNLIGISQKGKKFDSEYKTNGRFPANRLVSDDMLNDGVITKVQDNLKEKTKQYKGGNFGGGSVKNNFYFGDKGRMFKMW